MDVWAADIGIAYLEATTKEKLYIIGGPEFQELEGHIMVIHKTLYGLKSTCLRWTQRIHDIMLDMDFMPCRADPCVWLKKSIEGHCLNMWPSMLMTIHQHSRQQIQTENQGQGPLEYHIGCDYHLDPNATLLALPKTYISKILDFY